MEEKVESRDEKMLLVIHARQLHRRTHVSIILKRRRDPGQKPVADLSRRGEGDAAMRARSSKRLLKREIGDNQEPTRRRFENRAYFQRQRLVFRRAPHVVQ